MWAGKLYGFIKSKALDEIVTVLCREAVQVDEVLVDLGQCHLQHTLNQTMTGAKENLQLICPNCCKESMYEKRLFTIF